LKDSGGKELFSSYVNLAILAEDAEDYFDIPETKLRVRAWLAQRWPMLSGIRPALQLKVSEGGVVLFEGPLEQGQSASIGGFSLGFDDLRYWTYYQVVSDDGEPIALLGFWLVALGAALRYLFADCRVWVRVVRRRPLAVVQVAAQAAHCDTLFSAEFRGLVSRMELRLGSRVEPSAAVTSRRQHPLVGARGVTLESG